jgi:hypothetical protein
MDGSHSAQDSGRSGRGSCGGRGRGGRGRGQSPARRHGRCQTGGARPEPVRHSYSRRRTQEEPESAPEQDLSGSEALGKRKQVSGFGNSPQ